MLFSRLVSLYFTGMSGTSFLLAAPPQLGVHCFLSFFLSLQCLLKLFEAAVIALEQTNYYQVKLEIFTFLQNQQAIPEGKHSQVDTFTNQLECLELKIKDTCLVGQEGLLAQEPNCTFQDHIEAELNTPLLDEHLEMELVHNPSLDFIAEVELLEGEER